jgi:cation:H+ antiporter
VRLVSSRPGAQFRLVAERTGLGKAFVGVVILGIATSLPEIATTATASAVGNAQLAGNNLFGGIAMQVAVLAAVDAFALRRGSLTYVTPQSVLLMQGVLLVLLIGVAAAGVAAGELVYLFNVGLWPTLLALLYLAALYVMYRYEGSPRWEPAGTLEDLPQSRSGLKDARDKQYKDTPTSRGWLYLLLAAAGVLASGYVVAQTGDTLSVQTGLGGTLIGATLVALATSLPEVSTTFTAVRLGAWAMAISNILGTNAIEVALFFVADIFYREGMIFNALGPASIFLAALGIVVTCVYLWGMLERRNRTILGMGIDSAAVLVLYIGGMVVFYFISGRPA